MISSAENIHGHKDFNFHFRPLPGLTALLVALPNVRMHSTSETKVNINGLSRANDSDLLNFGLMSASFRMKAIHNDTRLHHNIPNIF